MSSSRLRCRAWNNAQSARSPTCPSKDLKRFFAFEADEPEHIDDIVALLEDRRAAIEEQRRTLDEAYAHVLRKLHYYGIRLISAAAARPPLRPFRATQLLRGFTEKQ